MMVFIGNGKKLHVSAYSGHLQVLTTFLLKEFYIICLNRVVMLRYHRHFMQQPPTSTGAYKIRHLHHSFLLTLHLPNRTGPHPATYKFIDPIDIPPNLA